jgi:hypothetical protein
LTRGFLPHLNNIPLDNCGGIKPRISNLTLIAVGVACR